MVYYLNYEDIGKEDRFTYLINNRERNTNDGFTALVKWLRGKFTEDGTLMDLRRDNIADLGIRNLNLRAGRGELLDVHLVFEKFRICAVLHKKDAYVVGYWIPSIRQGFQYNRNVDYRISNFQVVTEHNGAYLGKWDHNSKIGPAPLVEVIKTLCEPKPNLLYKATFAERLFIFLGEASRYKVVERKIAGLLKATGDAFGGAVRDDDPDGSAAFAQPNSVTIASDVRRLTEERDQTNINVSRRLPTYFALLFKSYATLSKSWCLYVMSSGQIKTLRTETADKCNIRNVNSLGSILATVITPNQASFIAEVRKHIDPDSRQSEYEEVLKRVNDLVKDGAAFIGGGVCDLEG